MTITWTTQKSVENSGVFYGMEKPDVFVTASQTAFIDGGEEARVTYIHKATLRGLRENCTYGMQFYAMAMLLNS